ncbi:MAG: hypothetical protein JWN93_1645 [Hyphomicrobiales bacterium]|nr:hypothetical protein [Hyphomicrobiales bacterium]
MPQSFKLFKPFAMLPAALGLALAAVAPLPALAAGPNAFDFVAMGDMPYNPPADYEKVDRLIARINASKPAFVVHVGDMISGSVPCTDANLEASARQLDAVEAPLVYTPGDNEWTDCHRARGGGFEPLDRLAKVRALMFPAPGRTLGKSPMSVETQARAMADRFGAYVENVQFEKNGVYFSTLHITGSNNNSDPRRPTALAEFAARDAANAAWMERAFAAAIAGGAKALVLAWQANVHHKWDNSSAYSPAFSRTLNGVAQGARAFGKPVLIVYGDYHFFEVGRFPGMDDKPIPGVTRLQVFGDQQVHAVRVTVDPDSPGVFGYTPLIAPENGSP